MSTAYTFPFGPTALAIGREKNPDPAPMSATINPGFKERSANTSSTFCVAARRGDSNVFSHSSALRGASCARDSVAQPANTRPSRHNANELFFLNIEILNIEILSDMQRLPP